MRAEFEFRSFMSRAELNRALQLTVEASLRLAPRMNGAEINRLENYAAALAAVAAEERRKRKQRPANVQYPGSDYDSWVAEIDTPPMPHFITRATIDRRA